jgi:hypothetical protein
MPYALFPMHVGYLMLLRKAIAHLVEEYEQTLLEAWEDYFDP